MGDRWILGIWDGRDAGAALVDQDGQLAFAVSEERLSRRRHEAGFPVAAIELALAERLARGGRLDGVAIAGEAGRAPQRRLDRLYRARRQRLGAADPARPALAAWGRLASRWFARGSAALSRDVLTARLAALDVRAPLTLIDLHAAQAWAASAGATDALVLTLGGAADGSSGGIHRLEGGPGRPTLRRCRRLSAGMGPGLVVEAITALLGFGEGEVGKVGARAARGDPERLRPAYAQALVLHDGAPRLAGRDAIARLLERLSGEAAEDIAAGLHAHLGELLGELVCRARRDFGGAEVRLGGDLFADPRLVAAVGAAALADGATDVGVFVAPGESGACAGAAWAARSAAGGPVRALRDARIGPLAWDESAPIPMRVPPLPILIPTEPVIEALERGAPIARCTRRLGFGEGGWGARSVLFVPDDSARAAQLNASLARDYLLPFTVLARAEDAPSLLRDGAAGWEPSLRLGGVSLPASATLAARAPAALHADGCVRLRLVSAEADPILHDLLGRVRGGVLADASLALPGAPLVHTLEQAAAAAARIGASMLWVG